MTSPALVVTGTEQQLAWKAGRLPPAEKLGPGTFSIPVPIPDNPLRYTTCYVLGGTSGTIVIDPGWDSQEGWLALADGLAQFDINITAIDGIVITHAHADHHGLSARLVSLSGAWVAMHQAEFAMVNEVPSVQKHSRTDATWLHSQGVPVEIASQITISGDSLNRYHSMPRPTVQLADGELLPLEGRQIRAIWTPGHTAGHLCFHDEEADAIFTGDHLLPRISPNISIHAEGADHPLAQYLSSLHKIAAYDSAEAYPAHEWRFHGIGTRANALIQHHEMRLSEIRSVLAAGPLDPWTVTSQLTWSRGWAGITGMMRRAALAETLAHLVHLVDAGELVTQNSDDIVNYQLR